MTHSYKGSIVAWLLTLLCLGVVCQDNYNYSCYGIIDHGMGTIEPEGDIIIEVGSSYEAHCLFNPDMVDVDEVYFKTTGSNPRRIPHTVVNNSAISIHVTHNEPTKYNLQCRSGNGTFLCDRFVAVGYKPQDVENFTCLSMNWQNLNCSWDVPENPVTVKYYNVTYVVKDYHPRDCPNRGNGKANWCYWPYSAFEAGRRHWTVIIKAINNLIEEPIEFRHDVDVYASVIPKEVTNFVANVLGPRSVILKWSYPHPIDTFVKGKVYQEVKYRIKSVKNELQNSPWVLVDRWKETPVRFTRQVFNRTISDLYPYVEYEFSIRLHTGTGTIREQMWSKPALLIRRTEATRPTLSPNTTLGMFEVEETKLHRDVYVSWQTLDPVQENGPEFFYEVRVFDGTNQSPVPFLRTTNGYAKFSRLENDLTYRFEIRPKNREGFPEDSYVHSVVVVPKKEALMTIPDYFKVIAYPGNNTTTYMLRWRLPEKQQQADQHIETVTLYWCKQTEYENRCQNKLSWEIVDDPTLHVKNLSGYDTTSRYMFGISVNSHNSSSGIKWSGCIARHGAQPPALEEFNYTYVSSTEVTLRWDTTCKVEAAQPNAFNISYCVSLADAKDCVEAEDYVQVDGESTVEYTVRNLHPFRHYLFNIAIISALGHGKWSPSVHVKTKPSKPSGPPQDMKVMSRGQTWISLAWDPPLEAQQNGEIIFYDIEYRVKDSLSSSHHRLNVLQFNFTNLDPFTDYHFKVIPCTRVEVGHACGMQAATIDVKTRIGAPGRIDSLEYDSEWLKWDHDECNGPNCFYQIRYTVNETNFIYNTSINHTAVSLTDLNIGCPVEQGKIPVSVVAVNTDEEDHNMFGPPKETEITCLSQGSYVILIPFSVNNQFSTYVNLLGVPEGFTGSVTYDQSPSLHARTNDVERLTFTPLREPIMITLLGYHSPSRSNRNYQQPSVHRNSKQIQGDESRTWRQPFPFYLGEHSISYPQRAPHANSRLAPLTRQNNMMLPITQASHGDIPQTQSHSEGRNDLEFGLSDTAEPVLPDEVNLGNIKTPDTSFHRVEDVSNNSYQKQTTNREPSTLLNSNESTVNKYKRVRDGRSNKMLCLLELMKAKNVEASIKASNESFELKIKGQGNLLELLQNIYFPAQSPIEAESEAVSENIVEEDMKDNDPPRSERLMGIPESYNGRVSLTYRNNETNITNGDVIQSSDLIDSGNNQTQFSAVLSSNSQSEHFQNNNTSFDGENERFSIKRQNVLDTEESRHSSDIS